MSQLPALLRENPYSWADQTRGELAVLRQEHPEQMGDFHAQVEAALAGVQTRFGKASEEFAAVAEVRVDLLREWGVLLGKPMTKAEAGAAGGKGQAVSGGNCLDKKQRHYARKLADIDADDFADLLLQCRERGKPPTVAGLIRAANAPAPKPPKRKHVGDERLWALAEAVGRARTVAVDLDFDATDLSAEAKAFLAEAIPALEGHFQEGRAALHAGQESV